MVEIGTVRKFWSDHINNEYYTKKERGTEEYFTEIEQRRYKHHYHLKDLFNAFKQSRKNDDSRMIEIGCGIGIDSVQLAKCGFKLTAIDLTEKAIQIARQRASDLQLDIDYQIGNAERLEYESNSFDYVYSFGVLHHTPNIQDAIDEIRRVLKTRGEAHIMLYARFSIVNLVHQLFRIPYESPQNMKDHCPVVYTFSVEDLKKMFSDYSGVEIHKEYPFTYGFRKLTGWMPEWIIRPLGKIVGWHLMIRAIK